MTTVWDRRNKKWVNVPKSWVDSPGFEEMFSLTKVEETPLGDPVVKVPAKATTKKEGTKDA